MRELFGIGHNEMTKRMDLGGSFTLPGTSMTLNRLGYGAMQLADPECGDHHVMLTVQLLFYRT